MFLLNMIPFINKLCYLFAVLACVVPSSLLNKYDRKLEEVFSWGTFKWLIKQEQYDSVWPVLPLSVEQVCRSWLVWDFSECASFLFGSFTWHRSAMQTTQCNCKRTDSQRIIVKSSSAEPIQTYMALKVGLPQFSSKKTEHDLLPNLPECESNPPPPNRDSPSFLRHMVTLSKENRSLCFRIIHGRYIQTTLPVVESCQSSASPFWLWMWTFHL